MILSLKYDLTLILIKFKLLMKREADLTLELNDTYHNVFRLNCYLLRLRSL